MSYIPTSEKQAANVMTSKSSTSVGEIVHPPVPPPNPPQCPSTLGGSFFRSHQMRITVETINKSASTAGTRNCKYKVMLVC